MSGKKILVDTNIVLYLHDGSDTIENFLQGKNIYLSFSELKLTTYQHDITIAKRNGL